MLPEPNIPLLRKAVEWAEAEAAKPDGQSLWRQQTWAREIDCGTAYCIAGYVVSISDVPGASVVANERGTLDLYVNGEFTWWDDLAIRLLGLPGDDDDWDLFRSANTIADVRRIAEEIAARAGERL